MVRPPYLRSLIDRVRTKSWLRILLVLLGILLIAYGLVVSPILIGNQYARSSQITNAGPSAQFPTEKIIARVLHPQPLIIEILDKEQLTGSVLDDVGVRGRLSVRGEQPKLSTLKFNDIISASMYHFLEPAGELAIGSAITDIQKLRADRLLSPILKQSQPKRSGYPI